MSERTDAYMQMFRSEGWKWYMADIKKAMDIMTARVMGINTAKPGAKDMAAKYIDRHEGVRRHVTNCEKNIREEIEKTRREKERPNED